MEWIKPGIKLNFVGNMLYAAIFSGTLVILSWCTLLWPGIRWGIDFAGGTEIHLRLDPKLHIDQLRQAVDELKLGGTQVQEFEAGALEGAATNEYLVRVAAPTEGGESAEQAGHNSELVSEKLKEKFGEGSYEILETNFVGPRVGKDLRIKGIEAMGYTLLGMLLYISFRYEFRFALGAILALFHDGSIVMGALVITQREFDLSSIAAILTILGYSINDTIVVFDRIRESSKRLRRLPPREMMNTALNETLSRTLLTSLTVFFTVFCLWLLGGGVIRDFSFAMMVGVIFGTWSSIFIATALVVLLEDLRAQRRTTAAPLKPAAKET
jgi:preprotein translocase subunit SecF